MNAEDLADLFELELDKLKNQYETVQRGAEQQADNQVDEALERLRELARRQEQEIERQRQLAGLPPNMSGGRGGSQADLARQTEELARRLERLAREQSSPAMQETARRLQDAANAMKRSSRAGQPGGAMGESAAALERLRDARRRLENTQAGRVERDIREARRAAQELARQQEEVAAEAEAQLAPQGGAQAGGARGARGSRLMEKKDEMAREVSELEAQLDKMAQDARADRKDAARKLQEAADAIRDRKLRDKIRYSKGVLGAGAAERSKQLETEIGSDLEALGRKLDQAASAAGPSDKDKRTAALERMRDLARNLESMQERLRERSPLGGAPKDEGAARGEDGQRQGRAGPPGGAEQGDGGQEGRQADGSGGAEGGGEQGQRAQGEGRGRQTAQGAPNGGPGGGSPQGGLAAGGRPRFTPGDSRQLRRELRERLREAEALGRELGAGGPYDLSDVVRGLRRGDSDAAFNEPRGLERLVGSVVGGLKTAEFALRREVEGPDREKLFLSGSQDVPAGWQRLVEEYYRSLARQGQAER
jgi:hypothetical protein